MTKRRTIKLNQNQLQMIEDENWPAHSVTKPDQILNHICLSGVGFTTDLPKWCKQNGFTHIVNAAGSLGSEYYQTHPEDLGIYYLELDMYDEDDFELAPHLWNVYDFQKHCEENNGKLLIHCIWGQSRSVSCLIYILMSRIEGMDYDMALKYIRKSRPEVNPNRGFEQQLRNIYSGKIKPDV